MGKVYNLCRVKIDISAELTVMSGLDPHMIIELEDQVFPSEKELKSNKSSFSLEKVK